MPSVVGTLPNVEPVWELLCKIWQAVQSLLSQRCWQGLGGIAQIIAAVFAIITIWQAHKTIRQNETMLKLADEQRRASVRSELVLRGNAPTSSPHTWQFTFLNSGPGHAWHVTESYEALSGNQPESLSWGHNLVREGHMLPAGQTATLDLTWGIAKSLDGNLTVDYRSSLGESFQWRGSIRTDGITLKVTAADA